MMDYEIRFQKLFPIVISKRYVYFYWRAILLLCDKENAINQKAIFLLIPLIMICTYSLITTLLVNQNDVYVRNLTTGGGLGFWMKALGTIFCFFIIYIYINNFHLSKVINSYIYFSFFYSLLTITIIFFFPSYYHSLPSRNWYGRLSIGYPTQDVFVLALSLFLLHSTISKGFKILIFITNVICLMMQNNATGYVLLATVFILTFIKGKMHVKFVSIVFFFVIIVSVYYFYNNYYLFDTFGQLVKLKIDSLIYGTADSSSIDERLLQVTNTMRTIYSDPIYF